MRVLFKLIKDICIVGFILIVLCIATAAVTVLKPNWVVNSKTLRLAAQLAALRGYQIDWSSLDIQVDGASWREKKLSLSAKDVCIDSLRREISGCFEIIQLGLVLDLSKRSSFLKKIGPFIVQSNHLSLWTSPSDKPSANKNLGENKNGKKKENVGQFTDPLILPFWLKNAKLHDINLNVNSIRISEGKRVTNDETWQGRVSVHSAEESIGNKWKVQIAADLRVPDRSLLSVSANLERELLENSDALLKYLIVAQLSKKRQQLNLEAKGEMESEKLQAQISAKVKGLSPEFKSLSLNQCDFSVSRITGPITTDDKGDQSSGRIQLHCPVTFQLSDELSRNGLNLILKEIKLNFTGDLKTSSFPPEANSNIKGSFSVHLPAVSHPIVAGKGDLQLRLEGKVSQFPESFQFWAESDLTFHVTRFEKVVVALKSSPWEIPAPFHVLKGMMDIGVKGTSDFKKFEIPLYLKTQMSSDEQRAFIDGYGVFKLKRESAVWRPQLDFEVNLSDVRLAIPRLDFNSIPRIFPDSRFQRNQGSRVSEGRSPFQYHVKVKTPSDRPVRIISNMARETIPLLLNLEVNNSRGLIGSIQVQKFPVNLFRREVTLKYLNVKLADPTKNSEMDGRIDVQYPDYNISIQMMSTLDHPTLKVFSDPPLSEAQVWAALIFGQPIEELDSEQAHSVNDLEYAVGQRAMDLASLYFLASTPIQSISYDPISKSLQAKIRLGKGISLNFGTELSEIKTIGIRKRLNHNWTLETSVDQLLDRSSRSLSTFIQWNYRH